MSVLFFLLAVGLGIAALSFSDPASLAAASAPAGMDQPEPEQTPELLNQQPTDEKRYGGSASCMIECKGPNGTSCRNATASCSLDFKTELDAKNYLINQLKLQAEHNKGRIVSGITFEIKWRWK